MKTRVHPSTENELGESKSSRKRTALDVQALGEELLRLDKQELQKLSLPDELLDALEAARTIHVNNARRRQLQYIGKLMRDVDPVPIRQALAMRSVQSSADKRLQHEAEDWREQMLRDGNPGLNKFLTQYPQADRDRLFAWMRDAVASAPHTVATARRQLFREIRRLISAKQLGT